MPGGAPSGALVAATLFLFVVQGQAQQPASANFVISEWRQAQAEFQVLAGNQRSALPSFAPLLGGEMKSPSYLTSFNFLTDEVRLSVAPPTDPASMDLLSPSSMRVAWAPSPDAAAGFVQDYRICVYTSPTAITPVRVIPSPGLGLALSVPDLVPGVPQYLSVEARYGAVYSSASPRFLCCTTANRLAGDANGDGRTDGRDFIVGMFALGVGSHIGHNPSADINADGVVSQSDLDLIAARMGVAP